MKNTKLAVHIIWAKHAVKCHFWAGSPKPRSASEAKTALFANESECITGRNAERHGIGA